MRCKASTFLLTLIATSCGVQEPIDRRHTTCEKHGKFAGHFLLQTDRAPDIIEDMNCSGYLENDRFNLIARDNPNPAQATDYRFYFSDDDRRRQEVLTFIHANQMAAWLEQGPAAMAEEHGSLDIEVYTDPESVEINVAKYVTTPQKSDSSSGKIVLGSGDGHKFANLMIDREVIWHEVSHHYIFRHIPTMAGDGDILHEALADFFTASATSDACIADTICTETSHCQMPRQCLRTLINDFTFEDEAMQATHFHVSSQVISGMLWRLAEAEPDGLAKWTTLSAYALHRLPSPPTLMDFVEALLAADARLAGGRRRCAILEEGLRRGLVSENAVEPTTCPDQ